MLLSSYPSWVARASVWAGHYFDFVHIWNVHIIESCCLEPITPAGIQELQCVYMRIM